MHFTLLFVLIILASNNVFCHHVARLRDEEIQNPGRPAISASSASTSSASATSNSNYNLQPPVVQQYVTVPNGNSPNILYQQLLQLLYSHSQLEGKDYSFL